MPRFIESANYMDYLDHIEGCVYEMETYTDISGEAGMLLLACVQKIRKHKGNWSENGEAELEIELKDDPIIAEWLGLTTSDNTLHDWFKVIKEM